MHVFAFAFIKNNKEFLSLVIPCIQHPYIVDYVFPTPLKSYFKSHYFLWTDTFFMIDSRRCCDVILHPSLPSFNHFLIKNREIKEKNGNGMKEEEGKFLITFWRGLKWKKSRWKNFCRIFYEDFFFLILKINYLWICGF